MTLAEGFIQKSEDNYQGQQRKGEKEMKEFTETQDRTYMAQRTAKDRRHLLSLGFTPNDIAVEEMNAEEMKNHLNVLEERMHKIWVPGIGNPIHDVLGLWGVPIFPGNFIEMEDGITDKELIYYCEYNYVDRKKYDYKVIDRGSLWYKGTVRVEKIKKIVKFK